MYQDLVPYLMLWVTYRIDRRNDKLVKIYAALPTTQQGQYEAMAIQRAEAETGTAISTDGGRLTGSWGRAGVKNK
jgi:hypothetical protein